MIGFFLVVLLISGMMFLSLSLLTYAFFWYETANTSYRNCLDRLSGGKTKFWLASGIFSSCLSLFLVAIFYPAGFCKRLWHPEADTHCHFPPVILVHGIYHNPAAWTLYHWWLKRAGFKNVYAFSYNSWHSNFDECLQQLNTFVKKICFLLPGRKVILLGHSLGGLLCRAYADATDMQSDVAAVITLGTPHQGSKMAVLGLGRLVKNLAYRGPLIEEMEQCSPNPDILRVAFYSPVDNMVLPNEALRSRCPTWSHQRISPISHVAVLFHRPTAKQIMEYIKNYEEKWTIC
jgi:pimeloyl-ACP methyl ester carboxylesterase